MSDTQTVSTWTEVDRSTVTKIHLAVTDAPLYDDLPTIRVQPTTVTLWIIDGEWTAAGFQGEIVSGPGAKSGGELATTFAASAAPAWVADLARQVL